jgi:KEOPS complex subunit Cgi121
MNLCAVLIDCDDYIDELESLFVRDDGVLEGDESKLKQIYNITDAEAENMSVEDIIVDRITRLIVDY